MAQSNAIESRIAIENGDITGMDVDAIVNAANSSLEAGGGVCGAIHRAAGPELLAECRQVGGCPTGEARITRGYRLPSRWVIHAVGPVWQGGGGNEDALLAAAYRNSLAIAAKQRLRTIAFPAISTGIFGFPLERATRIAVKTVREFLSHDTTIQRVLFVCFDLPTEAMYRRVLGR